MPRLPGGVASGDHDGAGNGWHAASLPQNVLTQLTGSYGRWNYFCYCAGKNIAQTVAGGVGRKRRPVPVQKGNSEQVMARHPSECRDPVP